MSSLSAVPPRSSDVTDLVRHALHSSGYPDLRRIDVKAAPRGVRLHGTVHSFYLKQIAQLVAISTDGVHAVDNQMEVA